MAVHYNPAMVTDGLIFYIDPGNTRSYPGSGSGITDMSFSRSSGQISNFNYVQDGSFGALSGNSGNAQISIFANTFSSSGPMCNCLKPTLVLGQGMIASYEASGSPGGLNGFGGAGIALERHIGLGNTNTGYGIYFQDGATETSQIAIVSTGTAIMNQWTYVCATWNYSNDIRLYINGELIESKTMTGIPFSGYSVSTASNRRCFGRPTLGSTNRHWNGYVGHIQYYSRDLSAAEISQNFNALRGRYGL